MNQDIIGFDALYESAQKCIKGVLWKDSTAHYWLNGIQETAKLNRQLETDTYQPRKPKEFTILSPKRRDILSVAFRDRVYQRSLNDNAIYPQVARHFIYDNAACQKGKGTDFCRNRLNCHLQRFYRKYGLNGYVYQIDIHGYYPNMNHAVAEATFKRWLDPESYERAVSILRNQYKGDKGYNPGSQLVQIAGIAVLDVLDHFCKEHLRLKHYIRYMDDIIIIHESKEYIEQCQQEINSLLKSMGFETNPKKTKIYSVKDGIKFLGFCFKLTGTGKVICLISSENVKAQRKKLRRMVGLAKNGKISKQDVDESFRCWKDHASKGNCYHVIQRMEKYYKELWKDGVT